MAALLTSQIGDTDSVVKYINEARELGLEVLPPDINESGYKFTVVGERRIRFGMGAIRNVGKAAIESLIGARADGPVKTLFELCDRIDLRLCNKRVLEALIGAGALDSLEGHRAQLLAVLDTAIQEASLRQQERASGQGSLFGGGGDEEQTRHAPPALPNIARQSESERLTREKEILGFYISGHPLEPFRAECELFASHTVSRLGTWAEGSMTLGVVITAIKRQISKRTGAEFARLTVEDFSGSSEVLVFPEAWSILSDRIRSDVPLLLKGGYSRRDQTEDNATFIVEGITRFEEIRASGQMAVSIDLALDSGMPLEVMDDVRAVVEAHHGSTPLELRWTDGNGSRARLRSRSLKLAATGAALTELRALLGSERVRLVRGS
jgi:DNA polymerase-3 subunit alpha